MYTCTLSNCSTDRNFDKKLLKICVYVTEPGKIGEFVDGPH